MPSCIRLWPITQLTVWALALLISACGPTQSTIKPLQPIKALSQPKLQHINNLIIIWFLPNTRPARTRTVEFL